MLYLHSLPINISFIKAHSILFKKLLLEGFKEALISFLNQLDNYIGYIIAK
jgi:hypothetical protein